MPFLRRKSRSFFVSTNGVAGLTATFQHGDLHSGQISGDFTPSTSVIPAEHLVQKTRVVAIIPALETTPNTRCRNTIRSARRGRQALRAADSARRILDIADRSLSSIPKVAPAHSRLLTVVLDVGDFERRQAAVDRRVDSQMLLTP